MHTVSDYLEQWLVDYAESNVTTKTRQRYAQLIRNNIVPILGDVVLDELTPMQVQSFYSHLLREGRTDGCGGLAPQTVMHIHRMLRKALAQAERWEIIARNPADKADPPRVPRTEMAALDRDGLSRLIASVMGTKLYLPVLLAATTGMRRGEICGLRWCDIDLDGSTLRVNRSMEQTQGRIAPKQPKSAKSRREVALAQVTVTALRDHKNRVDSSPEDLVIRRADGSPYPPDQLSAEFHRHSRRHGFGIRFHDLRHTHATHLLKDGVPVNVVSQRLGHAEPAITLNVYSHVLPGMQEKAAAAVDEMMAEVLAG